MDYSKYTHMPVSDIHGNSMILLPLEEYERLKNIEEEVKRFRESTDSYETLVIANDRVLGKSPKQEWHDLTMDCMSRDLRSSFTGDEILKARVSDNFWK